MKASLENIDTIFEFKGLWGIPSKCGIRRISSNNMEVVVVSELYQENPGTSITQMPADLAMQICAHFAISPEKLVYIEHSPDMNSKLSFYDEEFYKVDFTIVNDKFTIPKWNKLSEIDKKRYF